MQAQMIFGWLTALLLVLPVAGQPPKQKGKAKAPSKRPANPAPTAANLPYGKHPRQVLDFWKVDGPSPAPLVLYIHGGGWSAGDKSGIDVKPYLDHGIAVAAINYRYIQQAMDEHVEPPVKAPLHDAARALQFIRSKAREWNIDKELVGATGGSAGACTSLWLAFHPDLADSKSDDPIARESTRLFCAAVDGAQVSLDPKQLREWMPNMVYGGHAFGFRAPGRKGREEFERCLAARDTILPWIREYSPYELASKDDPPIFLAFPSQDKPPVLGEEQRDPTHSAVMGVALKSKLDSLGVECHLSYPGHPDPDYKNSTDFLTRKLKPSPVAANRPGAPLRLWSAVAPGSLGTADKDTPTLTPYWPDPTKASGAAMIVCPGGGYNMLAPHEGEAYARWLNQLGIAAFVLKYRLVKDGYHLPTIYQDAGRAVRLVRTNASAWELDPRRIGIMGSSAGGHLAATLLTHADAGRPNDADPIEHVSARPDLGILCYAFILFDRGERSKRIERQERFLGPKPQPEQINYFSPAQNVTRDTPPCFVWQTVEDTAVVVENALVFADALRHAGVPFDLHLYQKGKHGIGLGSKDLDRAKLHPWTSDCAYWLQQQGFVHGT